jgi:cytochrome c biogenesis protein CcdA
MLPAYLGLYVSGGGQDSDRRQPVMLIARALMVGLSVSAGFVVLFGAVGLILGLGSQAIVVSALPYVGLAVGVLLVGAGAFMAAGGKIYTSLAQRVASRVGDPGQLNVPGYVLFGVSYGLASLSCTLPLFLAVLGVGAGLSSGFGETISQFVLYALGMGSVILALTLGMAVARTVLVRWMRAALPYVGVVGAWLMVVAGTYIVFYWLTLGDLL